MKSVFNINIAALDGALVEEIKDRFGHAAELEIHVRNIPDSAEWLTDEGFWAIIEKLDWSKQGQNGAVLAPTVEELAKMPMACIHQFEDILAKKLWQLDTRSHAIASLPGKDLDKLSDDYFLYDRCCVVANGKSFFEKILSHPKEWPVGLSFSPLLNLASDAFLLKTGRAFVHLPKHNYETGSNQTGWA